MNFLPIVMTSMAIKRRDKNLIINGQETRRQIETQVRRIETEQLRKQEEMNKRIEEYEQKNLKYENLPINQLKQSIVSSNKLTALNLIEEVSYEELEEALEYLEKINSFTPKNKIRPIIREAIKQKLNFDIEYF